MAVIIGNKPYRVLQLNELIDNFGENIRLNFGLPNFNNGTKACIQYLNVHVSDNLARNNLACYEAVNCKKYLQVFQETFVKTNYKKIIRQDNNRVRDYNKYLRDLKCPFTFSRLPTLGSNSIFDCLLKKNVIDSENIFLANFSLVKYDTHMYNRNIINNKIHNIMDEFNIIKWLHNNNLVDATLSNLEDTELPKMDCGVIRPSVYITNLILKEYGICVLENFFNSSEIDELSKGFEHVFLNNKDMIEKTTKEECSNDERIFHAEKYSDAIKNLFFGNKFFQQCSENYSKKTNKKTLINRLTFEEGKKINSGAGWHRDNHNCQFKAIMYLTDVTEENGNFQYLTNSSKRHIGYPKPRTPTYNTRFEDETVEDIINKNEEIKLHNILGRIGTVILVDTTYIHRGNIIRSGCRKAITQYFF